MPASWAFGVTGLHRWSRHIVTEAMVAVNGEPQLFGCTFITAAPLRDRFVYKDVVDAHDPSEHTFFAGAARIGVEFPVHLIVLRASAGAGQMFGVHVPYALARVAMTTAGDGRRFVAAVEHSWYTLPVEERRRDPAGAITTAVHRERFRHAVARVGIETPIGRR